MRIVGGTFAGRDLASPADFRVRPTAEPVRAAVLDLLAADLPEARILDLFAGTGALGLEALSRGAAACDFVEWRPTSLWALKRNISRLGVKHRTRIFRHDAVRFVEDPALATYDVAFCDPPYESRQLDWVLRVWQERRFARVPVLEHAVTHALPPGHSTVTADITRVTVYRDASALTAARAPAPTAQVVVVPTATGGPAFVPRTGRRPSSRRR